MSIADSKLIFCQFLPIKASLGIFFHDKIRKSDHRTLSATLSTSSFFLPPQFSYELLQRKGSLTYLLHDTLLSFLKKLLFKFVWIENIQEYLCSISVSNRSIHCLKENVFIRLTIRQLLEKLVEYEEIGAGERDTFYNSFFELHIAIQFYNYRSVMLF